MLFATLMVHLRSNLLVDFLLEGIKFVLSKKATKNGEIFTVDLTAIHIVKAPVKISSIFVAFLENINFNKLAKINILSGH